MGASSLEHAEANIRRVMRDRAEEYLEDAIAAVEGAFIDCGFPPRVAREGAPFFIERLAARGFIVDAQGE